jgi:hypothetical protein
VADNTPSDLGKAVQDVSERLSLLVREEIALAKTEMEVKAKKLGRGIAIGVAAGIFAVAALIYLLHSLAWGLFAVFSDDPNFVWVGYLIVGGLLLLLGGLAGFLAARFIKGGTPPTPQMAIEEGKLIKETVTASRPARPIGAGGTVEHSEPAQRARERS